MILRVIMFLIISTLSFSEILLTTNNDNPSLNDPIKVTVEFKNMKRENYYLDGINNFEVLYKSSRSSTSWVNGKKTSIKSDVYTVMPSKLGKFDLSVWVKGELKSNRVRIEVEKNSGNNSNSNSVNKNISLDIKKLDKNYYFGEKIPYYEKMDIRTSLRNYGYVTPPVFDGFTAKDITKRDKNGYPLINRTVENGHEKIEIKLTENILEANSTGEKKIKEGRIKAEESTDDFFGMEPSKPMFFGGKNISVNILPLPEKGKPKNFQMVIGDLKGKYSWNEDNKAKLGESFSLKIKLSGNVNLTYLEKIVNEQNEDFNIYTSVSNESEKIVNNKYYATKDFEIAFIPKKIGKLKTPHVEIPYFDTKEKMYKVFKVPSKDIVVTGNYNDKEYEKNIMSSPKNNSLVDIKNSSFQKKETKEIVISNILEEGEKIKYTKKDLFLIILLLLALGEGGYIFKLLRDKKNNKKDYKDLFKNMLKASSNKDFYDYYCLYMKERYNFSPKAQFEDVLIKNGGNEDLINLNRKIEKNMFEKVEIDKKEVVSILKKNK
ncbi:BatD family protein [Fusobacterium sp. MFO224]|uniref:BatD family protein n=1 Tax=Fusobacterium sp. MFO224 TaxID=3378070 RepID=UPI0038522358